MAPDMVKLTTLFGLLMGVASSAATNFWYSNMDHTGAARGYAPDLDDDFSYSVYLAVKPGDGNSLRNAIIDDRGGKRHSKWLASQPRVST